MVYSVDTPDVHIAEYSASIRAENLYCQVDGDEYNYSMLYEIVEHRLTDDLICIDGKYYDTWTGVKIRLITTKVW